uniref:LuxR C-terminal-related transcriptional regulator n=1 Tax=Nocardia farcinica TaxID=37329 RepID=UPI002453C1CA
MIVALIDSGLGLLPTAAWLRKLRPDVDLLLQLDPDGAPWGPKPEQWTIERVVAAAPSSKAPGGAGLVVASNTPPGTPREQEILRLVGRGWSYAEIAADLHLAPGTVKVHVSSILRTTGA